MALKDLSKLPENKYRERTMFDDYMKQTKEMLQVVYPDKNDIEIQSIMDEYISQEDYTPVKVKLKNKDVDFAALDAKIVKEQPLGTGMGTFFKRRDEKQSMITNVINDISGKRSAAKKVKFEHSNDDDKSIYRRADQTQKSYKVYNNSLFGVLLQSSSFIYSPESGAGILGAAYDSITTAIVFFEKLIYGSVYLYKVDDVLQYIKNIVNEEYTVDISKYYDTTGRREEHTRKDLLERLASFVSPSLNGNEIELVSKVINNLSDEQVLKVWYKNNLMSLINDTTIFEDYLFPNSHIEGFMDANKFPKTPEGEKLQKDLEEVGKLIIDWVGYYYQDFYRLKNADNRERYSVLLSDTDSTFIYIGRLVDTMSKHVPGYKSGVDTDVDLTIVNMFMNLITQANAENLRTHFRAMNVPEDDVKLLSLKNEFVSNRIMMTKNKKSYAHRILLNEGIRLKEPDIDIKGLAIRKVSTSRKVRDYIAPIINEDILSTTKKIDYGKIIGKYMSLQSEIFKSLTSGDTDYLKPASVNEETSYKSPFTIGAYKGTWIWNQLYPANPITPPTRVLLFNTNIEGWNDLQSRLAQYPEILKNFEKVFKNDELMQSPTALNTIAIPAELEQVPEELVQFIDVEKIIDGQMKNTNQIIRSLGINVYQNSNIQTISNIIAI